jgi:uncharacterized protein
LGQSQVALPQKQGVIQLSNRDRDTYAFASLLITVTKHYINIVDSIKLLQDVLFMISPETLAILRCPFDASRQTPLVLEDDIRLKCTQCSVQFKIREGLPSIMPDEAILPEGCPDAKSLPCRKKK